MDIKELRGAERQTAAIPIDQPYRCTVCHQRFDAINALWHAQATGHTIVSRHGVVQVFSGVQAPLAAWAW